MENKTRFSFARIDSTKVRRRSRLVASSFLAVALPALFGAVSGHAATPADWQCFDKIGGQWNFGNAPNACNVSHKQDPAAVRSEFKPIMFRDADAAGSERGRYVSQLHPSLREFAGYYLLRRKPGATADEVAAFQRALFTLAHQESYWSHYRDGADGRVRYMRGDNGHGHGIMQIDDNAHFAEIDKGKGADFAENVVYGLGVFYSAWQQAASQSCVSSPTNWEERTRAAWGAYNGGPGSICRYKNPNSAFAKHDRDFKAKYDGQGWNGYVSNKSAPSPLDVKCLSEGTRPCDRGGAAATPPPQGPSDGSLYSASEGRYCLAKGGSLDCVSSLGDVECLKAREGRALPTAGSLSAQIEASRTMRNLDRASLCKAFVASLIPAGADLQLQAAINFRATPGGALIGQLPAGGVYRALDFAVENGEGDQDRYYKLSANGKEGWIYGGAKTNWASWAKPSEAAAPFPSTAGLAKAGETVEIVPSALNLRQTPGGNPVVGSIPGGARVVVQEALVRGSDSDVYYKVTYASKTGYVYSGSLRPTNTVASWTRVVPSASPNRRLATLHSNVAYRYLRTCGGPSCSFSNSYVLGAALNNQCQNSSCTAKGDLMEVLQIDGGWAQVRKLPSGETGWLQQADVVEFAP